MSKADHNNVCVHVRLVLSPFVFVCVCVLIARLFVCVLSACVECVCVLSASVLSACVG